ncbi:MAG: PIN domain-containing protein [Solirubrobacterales bacterium]|nr:PIN domain-containing protein [Solirubrobacterales bacterium]
MTALIDTSVLVGGITPEIDEPWTVSVITIGELQTGVLVASGDSTRAQRLRLLTAVLAEAPVVEVDHIVSARYAELRAAGRRPTNDLWIAATALAHDYTLITADQRHAASPLIRAILVRPAR